MARIGDISDIKELNVDYEVTVFEWELCKAGQEPETKPVEPCYSEDYYEKEPLNEHENEFSDSFVYEHETRDSRIQV